MIAVLVIPLLTFRPRLIPIIYVKQGITFQICKNVSSILNAFASVSENYLQSCIGLYISIIPHIICLITTFRPRFWISESVSSDHIHSCIVHIVNTTIFAINRTLNQKGSEITIVAGILSPFITSHIIKYFISRSSNPLYQKILNELDEYQRNPTTIDNIPLRKMYVYLKIGFEYGHPICHKWILFVNAIQRFPKDKIIAILYARYAAIYYSEMNNLVFAEAHLKTLKSGSLELKHLLFQINSLLQQREKGLSKSLKKKLDQINSKTKSCRNQLRYIWESIIRGNIGNIEILAERLKRSEDEIIREYNQLCLMYPNNQYVASAYSTFLTEIVKDEKEASEYSKLCRELRAGTLIKMEKAYYFASLQFPELPSENEHKDLVNPSHENRYNSNSSISSINNSVSFTDDFDVQNQEKNQKKSLEQMIETVKLPSMKFGPTALIIIFCIVLPLLFITMIFLTSSNYNHSRIYFQATKTATQLSAESAKLTFFILHYACSVNGKVNNFKDDIPGVLNINTYTFDDDFNIVKTQFAKFQSLYADLTSSLYKLESYHTFSSSLTKYFGESINHFLSAPYFGSPAFSVLLSDQDSYNFDGNVFDPNKIHADLLDAPLILQNSEILSITTGVAFLSTCVSHILSFPNNRKNEIFNFTNFWKVIRYIFWQIFSSFLYQEEFAQNFEVMITNINVDSIYRNETCGSVIIVLVLVACFLLSYKLGQEKQSVYNCFKVIPKSNVSDIIKEINAQSGTHTNDQFSVRNPQEDNVFRTLASAARTEKNWKKNSNSILIGVIAFILILFVLIQVGIFIPSQTGSFYRKINSIYPRLYQMNNAQYGMLINLYLLILSSNSTFNSSYPQNYNKLRTETIMINRLVNNQSHILRHGIENTPLVGIASISNFSDIISHRIDEGFCKDRVPINSTYIFKCIGFFSGINFESNLILSYFEKLSFLGNPTSSYPPDSSYLLDLDNPQLTLLIAWLYYSSENYIDPIINNLEDYINSALNRYINIWSIISSIVLVLILTLIGIFITSKYIKAGEILQWSLRLLFFFPSQSIINFKPVMKILSNDFSSSDNEDQLQNNLYESIINLKPDPIIIVTPDLIIRSINIAAAKMFRKKRVSPKTNQSSNTGSDLDAIISRNLQKSFNLLIKETKKKEPLIGRRLSDVFSAPENNSASLRNFFEAMYAVVNGLLNPKLEMDVEIETADGNKMIKFSLNAISSTGHIIEKATSQSSISFLVLSCKDVSEYFIQRQNLIQEGIQSKTLLDKFLPPMVVKRLVSNNMDLLWLTQTASVCFASIMSVVDEKIVPFSSWAEQKSAVETMSTFNKIMDEMDRILSRYPQLSKIDSIGSSYLVVSGLFEDIVESTAATQVVSFGLDCINAIEQLTDNEFQIRVGANIGGPLVGTVFGKEKPSFSVLGPTVGLTKALEMTGVPKTVQISQQLYELIFGNTFSIKDRNENLMSKYQSVHTYLVTGYQGQI